MPMPHQIFDHQTRALTEKARMTLQDRWDSFQNLSSNERIATYVGDILKNDAHSCTLEAMEMPCSSRGYLTPSSIGTCFDKQGLDSIVPSLCSYTMSSILMKIHRRTETEERTQYEYFHK